VTFVVGSGVVIFVFEWSRSSIYGTSTLREGRYQQQAPKEGNDKGNSACPLTKRMCGG